MFTGRGAFGVFRQSYTFGHYTTDYRKAFDLIDHNILCQKLQQIGIKPSVFNWIVDFLRARSQRVKLHSDCFSDWKPINAGVPQGTKLGPWLFLLMTNDLSIPSQGAEKYDCVL